MPATQPSAATPESTIITMVFRVLSAAALLFYVAIYLPVSLVCPPPCDSRPKCILSCPVLSYPVPSTPFLPSATCPRAPLPPASTSSPAGTRCFCSSRRKGSPTLHLPFIRVKSLPESLELVETESPARRRDCAFTPSLYSLWCSSTRSSLPQMRPRRTMMLSLWPAASPSQPEVARRLYEEKRGLTRFV
ncbi:uncharacterized protein LY79DRAFT_391486 [Colletotrichum navitas]|uniref:Uncharacterized protein n=1 Tax=Colletotrichum navitas TaxID=681940 RepID=A0AAD8PQU0_9PEZI|nr:uncharacterized protein LY79DRAFT_391486 [Colletotrichum navitas]KAK1574055.1 hypothetical protein LY79DRAFT_391486 [Colletotrichum navitas]